MKVVDLNTYRAAKEASMPVWRVVIGRCSGCGYECVSVQHEECPLDNTECASCREWLWSVTHFVPYEGQKVPRLKMV